VNVQQNIDGRWVEARPLPPQGFVARLEFALRRRGHHRIAGLLGRLDEVSL
jgi:hypothetical protein